MDDDVHMTLHVRRVGLPRPGRVRELLEHVADFHATLLDRDRPLWQAHLVEGLADGRFAGQLGAALRRRLLPIARLREVARDTETSLNDVALTTCAGALRAYLLERDALPRDPLVAMVPVSMSSTDPSGEAREGNSWVAVLCNLGTDTADDLTRLRRINNSMRRSKRLMSNLDPVTATAVSGAVMGGALINTVPGVPLPPRPAFNLVISNVPAVATLPWHDQARLPGCANSPRSTGTLPPPPSQVGPGGDVDRLSAV